MLALRMRSCGSGDGAELRQADMGYGNGRGNGKMARCLFLAVVSRIGSIFLSFCLFGALCAAMRELIITMKDDDGWVIFAQTVFFLISLTCCNLQPMGRL